MDEETLNKVQYNVGVAMRYNPLFRTHKGRGALVDYVKALGIDCSIESITRSQRHLWTLALKALLQGNTEYAFQLLPSNYDEFEDWCKIRKVDAELYRRYYGKNL